ncbi:EGF-like repeat and discoidin I-like domain-containing protein 3 [Haliotis rubra]|uniref:EGF-like repeat and discoidin I-like domain-containing protein 3 n=1 Tax=Haliotis rubra TaxID=36100 RepID=UPI001EE50F5E|nr:EGF-like repeat and discoidin I-like domain-containing protein 3 [Haliotis rubra]
MASAWYSTCLLAAVVLSVNGASQFTPIVDRFPSMEFVTGSNGSMTLEAQMPGNVSIITSDGHTVYYKNVDLLKIIRLVNATPPIWDDYGTYGYVGSFLGLQKISAFIHAKDPEDRGMTYTVIAGDLPVGISLDPLTGELKGVAPDLDATYVVTVRVTNTLGAFADAIFKIAVKNSHVCMDSPCLHESTCEEHKGTFRCDCLHPYGGKLCELNCTGNALGVSQSVKTVHNAQMSAYLTYTTYSASDGRIGGKGWFGVGEHSWLQIDLGNQTLIHGVQMQGQDGNYYTSKYLVQYSLDGSHFHNYTNPFSGVVEELVGSTSAAVVTSYPGRTLPLLTRYVRLVPTDWNKSYMPNMRVELLGCHLY